jgi:hypothetical protein
MQNTIIPSRVERWTACEHWRQPSSEGVTNAMKNFLYPISFSLYFIFSFSMCFFFHSILLSNCLYIILSVVSSFITFPSFHRSSWRRTYDLYQHVCLSASHFAIYSINWRFFMKFIMDVGARGSVVVWGTMLQAGRSRVRFPMRSLDYSIYLILPMALGSTQPLIEMSTRNLPGAKERPAGP